MLGACTLYLDSCALPEGHGFFCIKFLNKSFMESLDKRNQNLEERSSQDPRERLVQNPAMDAEELKENTSHGDKNDLLNEDPDEERREIEKSSEDNLSSAE
jgi:hypothetical protein